MDLKSTGKTKEEIKEMYNKYFYETFQRFDFIAEKVRMTMSSMRLENGISILWRVLRLIQPDIAIRRLWKQSWSSASR